MLFGSGFTFGGLGFPAPEDPPEEGETDQVIAGTGNQVIAGAGNNVVATPEE